MTLLNGCFLEALTNEGNEKLIKILKPTKKYFTMKILTTFGVLFICLISCKKSTDNKTCWDCEVQRRDGTTYRDRTCGDNPPQYTDNLGNDLNAFCTKR